MVLLKEEMVGVSRDDSIHLTTAWIHTGGRRSTEGEGRAGINAPWNSRRREGGERRRSVVVTGGQRRGAAGDWRGGRERSSLAGGARWSMRLGGKRNSENGGRRRVGIPRRRQSLIMRVSRRRWGRIVVGVRRSRSREETEGRSLMVGRRSVVMGVRRRCRLKRGTCSSRRLSRRKS